MHVQRAASLPARPPASEAQSLAVLQARTRGDSSLPSTLALQRLVLKSDHLIFSISSQGWVLGANP